MPHMPWTLYRFISLSLILLLATCLLIGCGTTHKREKASGDRLYKEARLQRQLEAEQLRLQRIEKEKRSRRVQKIAARLNKATYGVCRELTNDLRRSCSIRVRVVESENINAYADGKTAYIHKGIIDLTDGNDDELAYIIAHEMAHNFLSHIDKKEANRLIGRIIGAAVHVGTGIDATSLFEELGGLAYSQDFEAEADYVGLYLVARANYDYVNSPAIWRKMPGTAFAGFLSTHPGDAERYIELDNTAAEIHDKQLFGLPVLPDKKNEDVVKAHIEKHGYEQAPEELRVREYEYAGELGINAYTPPDKKRVLGKWSLQAEQLATQSGCFEKSQSEKIARFISSNYGVESYELTCVNGQKITASCEYGSCIINN